MPIEDNNTDGWDCTEKQAKQDTAEKKKFEHDLFVKLAVRDKPFRIRLITTPSTYRTHWMAFRPINGVKPVRSPAVKYSDRELDLAWSEGGWEPQERFSSKVFDRDDPGCIKILDGGRDLFEKFGDWAKSKGKNPAGNNGTDWLITVKPNKKGKPEISSVFPDDPTPFTEEEKKLIENDKINISKILKAKTPEEIKDLWLKLPDDKKYNPYNKKTKDKKFDSSKFSVPSASSSSASASVAGVTVKTTVTSVPPNDATYNAPEEKEPEAEGFIPEEEAPDSPF